MPYLQLHYHLVWSTRGRDPTIAADWAPSLYRVLAAKGIELGAVVHAVGGTMDHVHMVVTIPPTVAVSTFVGQVKGNSSHWVNRDVGPETIFSWQEEYSALTLTGKALPSVIRYVKDQSIRHAGSELEEPYER